MHKFILFFWILFPLITFRGEIFSLMDKNQDNFFAIDITMDFTEDFKEIEDKEIEIKETGISNGEKDDVLHSLLSNTINFKQISIHISNHIISLFIPPPNN